jgi:hypothetical protein
MLNNMIASFSASNQVGELMKKEMKKITDRKDHKIENHNSTIIPKLDKEE